MEDIIIDATQYKDLKITYSEKNNIDNVTGTEYRILGTDTVDFSFPSSNYFVDTNGKITIGYTEHTNDGETPSSSFLTLNDKAFPFEHIFTAWDAASATYNDKLAGKYDLLAYLRTEDYVLHGTFTAVTDQPIQDIDTVSVSYNITYDKYHYQSTSNDDQPILEGRYNSSLNPTYEVIRKPENKVESEGTTDIGLNGGVSTFKHTDPTGLISYSSEVSLRNSPPHCAVGRPKVTVTELGTVVEVEFFMSLWFAFNKIFICDWGLFGQPKYYDYELLNVLSIQFRVSADTVETSKNEFKYGDEEYREYALDTNELMQFEPTEPIEERQSYKSSQKMLDKSQINRLIVSLDLLKCDKIVKEVVKEATDNEPEITNYRYLRTGDLIKIKDQNDDYVGQYYNENGELITPYFEIISYHGRWDGTFHIELVCKQKF